MARIILAASLLLLSMAASASYPYPGLYNPFPIYFWEQELHRRQAQYNEQVHFECEAIREAWKYKKDHPKIKDGVYEIYAVSEHMDDWRKVDVIVVNQKLIQVGNQTLSDGSRVSKGRARGTLAYKEGGSALWYFYFIRI